MRLGGEPTVAAVAVAAAASGDRLVGGGDATVAAVAVATAAAGDRLGDEPVGDEFEDEYV